MRSNAGMANRQGDVDLRLAHVSVPVRTLAWLAWLTERVGTALSELVCLFVL